MTTRLDAGSRTTGVLAVGVSVAAVAVAAWLFVRYPGVLVSGVANSDPKSHVDFETFYRSSVALLDRSDVYRTGSILPNLNPPLLALLLTPFAALPAAPSYWAFTAVSVLVMTTAVLLVCRELRLGAGWTVLAVLTLWAGSPLHGTLVLGQIYGLLMFGLVLGWLAQRRGRPVLGAAVLGVAVAVKPSLAPVLLIPLPQRRFRVLVAGVVGAGVATIVGVLAAGPASALSWLKLASGTPAPEVDANASLPGLVARLGGPGALGWVLTVAIVAASLWWVRHAIPAGGPVPRGTVGPTDAALFAVAAGCLLAAPIAWLNYFVLLWPGALLLIAAGRWRIGLPLLVVPVVPVAWGNLWQADPESVAALAGRSLYCLVLVGYWVALLRFAATAATPVAATPVATAPVSDPAGASGSNRNQSTPVGGTRSTADAGRPCHGSSPA
jgi:arabinofuranan 3-O-arabinosyltransferase